MATPFPTKDVIVVAITGAAGQIGYSLLPMIARGLMFGPNQKVKFQLLDIEPAMKALEGVKMEMIDSAYPLLVDTLCTSDASAAFKDADACVMCGAFPRKPGMERKDLLQTNCKIFSEQGRLIGDLASPHCRIVVVGNPANTNALILATAANGKIDPRNITALTRLDHNRATAQCSLKGNVPITEVKKCIIWGNHSGTQVPDVNSALIGDKSVRSVCNDDAWFDGDFIKTVQQRGAAVIQARGLSSAASAAKAIVDHMHDWILGTPAGTFVSMAVHSTGNPYGMPDGLIFSFPVECEGGNWKIVPGLPITDYVKGLMEKTSAELLEEKEQAGL